MAYFKRNLHTQISSVDSVPSTTFYKDHVMDTTVLFLIQCDITVGNDVARDVHYDIIMGHDIVMSTYHDVTMHTIAR